MGDHHRPLTSDSDRANSSKISAPTKKAAHVEDKRSKVIEDGRDVVVAQALDVVTDPSNRQTPVTAPKSLPQTSSPHRPVGPTDRSDSSKISPAIKPRLPDSLPALPRPSPAVQKRVAVVEDSIKSRLMAVLETIEGEEFLYPNKVPSKKAEREVWLASSLADIAVAVGEAKPDITQLTADGTLRTTLLQTLRPKVMDILGKAKAKAKLPTFIR